MKNDETTKGEIYADTINMIQMDAPNKGHAVERVPREELLYGFELEAKDFFEELDDDNDMSAEDCVADLLPRLVSIIPLAAFDPIEPEHKGILFYNKEITEDNVSAACSDLMRCHLNLKGDTPIWLHFSSVGGSIYAGLVMCSTIHQIQRMGRDVNIHIQGVAMSMGSLIAQVCDTRTIEDNAFFMLHEMSDVVAGSLSTLKNEVKFSQMVEDACNRLYSARTGKSPSYYEGKTKNTNWYMTASEALSEGLVDEVIPMPRFTYTAPAPAKERRARKGKNESAQS